MSNLLSYFNFEQGGLIFFLLMGMGLLTEAIRKFTFKSYARISYGTAHFVDTKLTCIGVMFHEMAHAVLATLSGAKVERVKLFSFSTKKGALGQVEFIPRGPFLIREMQSALSGTAPVTLGGGALFVMYTYLLSLYQEPSWYTEPSFYLVFVLAMQIAYHMSLSEADIKVAIRGLPFVYFAFCFAFSYVDVSTETIIDYFSAVFLVLLINLVVPIAVHLFYFIKMSRRHMR